MNADDVPDITPDLSPEDDAAVRALLAGLGSDAGDAPALPADVRARVEASIVEQAQARAAAAPARNVRRLALAWVGAAAAVVIGVVGVGAVAQQFAGRDDAATTSDTSALRETEAGDTDDVPSPAPTRDELGSTQDSQSAGAPVVRPDHLAEDAEALLRDRTAARVLPQAPDGCVATRPNRPGSRVFSVIYRDEPAVLIVSDGPPRTAAVWSCEDELLQSVELPAS